MEIDLSEHEEDDIKSFVGKSLRVFISYSSDDRVLASFFKQSLEYFGLEVFIAHDDIQPTQDWQDVIIRTLKQSDVIVALLTENFKKSDYTDQEMGLALAQEKLIIPIKVYIDPYGFIAKYQALKLKFNQNDGIYMKNCMEACKEIIKTIFELDDLRENLKDCLIRAMSKSGSFYDTKIKVKILENFEDFSVEQINEIISISIGNNQIYKCYEAQDFLKNLMKRYEKIIDNEKSKELTKLIEDPSL